MPYRVSKNCSKLLDMTQTCPTKMLKIARNDPSWPEETALNCSKLLKVAQNCSKLFKIAQHYSTLLKIAQHCAECLKMFQNVSKWVNKCLKGNVLAYAVAKVVTTWHCCCRCLLLHGLAVSVNFAEVIPAARFRPLNRKFQLTGITCH